MGVRVVVALLLCVTCVWAKAAPLTSELLQVHEQSRAESEIKIQQLQSLKDLSGLLDEGRQKLAAARSVVSAVQLPSIPEAPLPAPPPPLESLVLPSYGSNIPIDELADIHREQNALQQKKLLVAQQKRIIQESEESAAKLQQLITVNKQIAEKNEQALAAAGEHLLERIKRYSEQLAQEQQAGLAGAGGGASGGAAAAGTGGAGAAAAGGATAPAALIEDSSNSNAALGAGAGAGTVVGSQQQFAQIQDQLRDQQLTIQNLQKKLEHRRRRRQRRRREQEEEEEEEDNAQDVDDQDAASLNSKENTN